MLEAWPCLSSCLYKPCGRNGREVSCLLQTADWQGQRQGSGQVYVHRLCWSGNAVLARPRPTQVSKGDLGSALTSHAVPAQNDIVYLVYKLPTVVISRRTDQYSKAHEILTGVAASAAKRPRTAPMLPSTAASVPPPGALQRDPSVGAEGLAHASTAPEGAPCALSPVMSTRPKRLHQGEWQHHARCDDWLHEVPRRRVSMKKCNIGCGSCAGAFRESAGQPAVVDGAYIRQWIHLRYKACQFRRYMSESDMSVRPLLTHSGSAFPSTQGRCGLPTTSRDVLLWHSSRTWRAHLLLCSTSAPAPGKGTPGLSENSMCCCHQQGMGWK